MIRSLKIFLVVASIGSGSFGSQTILQAEPSQALNTAPALMQLAHDGRGEWSNFPGFQAAFKAVQNNEVVYGTVNVDKAGDVNLHLPDADNHQWIQRSIESLISHRLSSSGAILEVQFADDQVNHPRGRLLKSTTSTDKTLWRVKDDLLTEVHRFNPKTHFIISISDVWRNAEGKHLPQNFIVTTWDVQSNTIVSVRQVHTDWQRIGSIDLPTLNSATTQSSDGRSVTQTIEFSDYQLLPVEQAQ